LAESEFSRRNALQRIVDVQGHDNGGEAGIVGMGFDTRRNNVRMHDAIGLRGEFLEIALFDQRAALGLKGAREQGRYEHSNN
jgi:hypothetical protein